MNEERVTHQRELDRAVHLVHQAVEEAKRSGLVADRLACKITELQTTLDAKKEGRPRQLPLSGSPVPRG